jgi:hypothetical protein
MKRINRKKILCVLEEARSGFLQAHMQAKVKQDDVLRVCMSSHYYNINKIIIELGGDDIKLLK